MADLVFGEFKKEHPYATKIYGKSDNAGSYHGNFGAETFYKICKSKGVNLVWYDYNEPCCGKDQCDQESVVAKNLIRSFVDAGNDVISANDIFKALQFAKGMKNTKVGVVEIDPSMSILKGKTIPDISQFHSVKIFDDGMGFWRYFDLGEEMFCSYTNVLFKSGVEISLHFVWASKDRPVVPETPVSTKRRENRGLCPIFCSKPLCSDIFYATEELQKHIFWKQP